MVGPRNLVNYGNLDLLKQFRFPNQSDGNLNPAFRKASRGRTGSCTSGWGKTPTPTTRPIEISRLAGGEVDPSWEKSATKGDIGHRTRVLTCPV